MARSPALAEQTAGLFGFLAAGADLPANVRQRLTQCRLGRKGFCLFGSSARRR
jgi:hypothetical protein